MPVNGQIMEAVEKNKTAALGIAKTEGNGLGYQMVAQATAMATQDAVDYMRNVDAVAAAAIGVGLAMILANENVSQATEAIGLAQTAVTTAAANFAAVGASAATVLTAFSSS